MTALEQARARLVEALRELDRALGTLVTELEAQLPAREAVVEALR